MSSLSGKIGIPNPTNVTEYAEYDFDRRTLREQVLKSKNDRYVSDTKDRKWLAQWTAAVVSIWLCFVIGILVNNTNQIKLSDTVLVTLLGTTTVNVLGLSFIVLSGHFKSSIEQSKKNNDQ